jgi:hypothetical protein
MKKKLAEKLLLRVAETVTERHLQVVENILFEAPIRNVLRGLCLEGSGFDAKAFHPSVFVQPMFEKSSCVALSLGERFLGNWSSEDEHVVERLVQRMRAVGLAIWDKYGSTEKLASLPLDPRIPRRAITTGYSLILCRRFGDAARTLEIADEQQSRIYGDQMNANPSFWPNALHAEVTDMLDKLRNDPEASIRMLGEWRLFTLSELKLVGYASGAGCPGLGNKND